MRAIIIAVIAIAGCLPMAQPGAYDAGAPFSGTFSTQGGTITLQQSRSQVTGSAQGGGVSGQIFGYVSNDVLSGQFTPNGGQAVAFTAVPTVSGLSVTLPGRAPIAFTRGAGSAGAGAGTVDPSLAPSPQIADILAGTWWHYHGTTLSDSSSSYERTLELCRDGRFFDSSNSDISATSHSNMEGYDGWGNHYTGSDMTAGRYAQDGGAGRWTATGDAATGQLQLVFNNGTTEAHQYVFQKVGGGDIELDGRWYGYTNEKGGQCR